MGIKVREEESTQVRASEGRDAAESPSAATLQLKAGLRGMGYAEQSARLAPAPEQVHATAAQGVSGTGGALPHMATIQGAFGRHDVSAVQAHVGGAAAQATEGIGARAYAVGNDVAFGAAPDLHTTAHEAAHVVQQRAGVSLAGGVGTSGDTYEQHADRVADAVVAGQNAEPILDELAPSSSGSEAVQSKAVQCYTSATVAGQPWRIADDQTFAVRQDSAVYGGRHFYADSGLIASCDSTLAGQKSMLSISAGSGSMNVDTPTGAKKTLTRVEPMNRKNKSSGNDRAGGMMWPEDCGVAANSVMHGAGRTGKGAYNMPQKTDWLERVRKHIDATGGATEGANEQTTESETDSRHYGTVYYRHRGARQFSPQQILNDIFMAVSGAEFGTAWKDYQALNEEQRDAFDRIVGINRYAQAEVGEAYSVVANRDENIDQGVWNFHWGGVVMRSGGDSVTMENFAGSGEDAWDYQVYGPPSKEGQTFHEQQEERTKHDGVTPEYGDNPSTIRVKPG